MNATVQRLLSELGSPWLVIRERAVESLVDLGAPAIEPLAAVLRGQRPVARRLAAVALGRIGDQRALRALRRALGDPSPDVRTASVHAVRKIGGPRAAATLGRALADDREEVRREATSALAAIGGPLVIVPICIAMTDASHAVRRAATDALWDIGDALTVARAVLGHRGLSADRASAILMVVELAYGGTTVPQMLAALCTDGDAAISERAIEVRNASMLLRPAERPDETEKLLRPATAGVTDTADYLLVRPASSEAVERSADG
jgi:hypothetical protein